MGILNEENIADPILIVLLPSVAASSLKKDANAALIAANAPKIAAKGWTPRYSQPIKIDDSEFYRMGYFHFRSGWLTTFMESVACDPSCF